MGCFYGNRLAAWGLLAIDESGELAARLPVQIFGALLSLLSLWIVQKLSRRRISPGKHRRLGESAWVALVLFAAGWLALSFLRASPAPILAGLAWDAWMAIFFIALALAMLLAPVLLVRLHSNSPPKQASLEANADIPDSKEKAL
jgi:prolipoprotein diacylglyceryltransferase